MASSIGIKIANGEFYPILSDSKPSKKRMVLTTVHDGQKSVQIDLFCSGTKTMSDARHIGSLVVEKLKKNKKGEPSVELVIARDDTGDISAEAKDLDNPRTADNARLSVSFAALENGEGIDLTGFGLESDKRSSVEKKGGKAPFIIVALLVVLLTAGFAVWWFLLGGSQLILSGASGREQSVFETPPSAPPAVVESAPVEPPPVISEPVEPFEPADNTEMAAVSEAENPVEPEAVAAAPLSEVPPPEPAPAPVVEAPPPVISEPPPPREQQEPVARPRAPVWSYKVPDPFPEEGIDYQVRRGDTLWDIAHVFYRNPWRYRTIANYNALENPNMIESGDWIVVPHL